MKTISSLHNALHAIFTIDSHQHYPFHCTQRYVRTDESEYRNLHVEQIVPPTIGRPHVARSPSRFVDAAAKFKASAKLAARLASGGPTTSPHRRSYRMVCHH